MKKMMKILSATVLAAGLLMSASVANASQSAAPDAFGYTWTDSLTPAPSISYSFYDIYATGTDTLLGDDQVLLAVPIGFTFNYYGDPYTTVNISSNGILGFGPTTSSTTSGAPFPTPTGDNNVIGGLWDDLNPAGIVRGVVYQTVGVAPDRRFIVQWTNVPFFNTVVLNTFQIVLFENGNRIQFRYASITERASANSGIENVNGTIGLAYYPSAAPGVHVAEAVEFDPPGVSAPAPAPAPVAAGGGGCSLDASAGFDPLFGMLVLLAFGALYRRRNDI